MEDISRYAQIRSDRRLEVVSSSLDNPLTGKSTSIAFAFALRACEPSCVGAKCFRCGWGRGGWVQCVGVVQPAAQHLVDSAGPVQKPLQCFSFVCFPMLPVAFRCFPLLPVASCCFPWLPVAFRARCRCLSLLIYASGPRLRSSRCPASFVPLPGFVSPAWSLLIAFN